MKKIFQFLESSEDRVISSRTKAAARMERERRKSLRITEVRMFKRKRRNLMCNFLRHFSKALFLSCHNVLTNFCSRGNEAYLSLIKATKRILWRLYQKIGLFGTIGGYVSRLRYKLMYLFSA